MNRAVKYLEIMIYKKKPSLDVQYYTKMYINFRILYTM